MLKSQTTCLYLILMICDASTHKVQGYRSLQYTLPLMKGLRADLERHHQELD
jgi:hypothetical protein